MGEKKANKEPVRQFFFMTYEYAPIRRMMWLLSGVEREKFLAAARLYKEGELVHANFIARNDMLEMAINHPDAIPPATWLRSIVNA